MHGGRAVQSLFLRCMPSPFGRYQQVAESMAHRLKALCLQQLQCAPYFRFCQSKSSRSTNVFMLNVCSHYLVLVKIVMVHVAMALLINPEARGHTRLSSQQRGWKMLTGCRSRRKHLSICRALSQMTSVDRMTLRPRLGLIPWACMQTLT